MTRLDLLSDTAQVHATIIVFNFIAIKCVQYNTCVKPYRCHLLLRAPFSILPRPPPTNTYHRPFAFLGFVTYLVAWCLIWSQTSAVSSRLSSSILLTIEPDVSINTTT